MRHVASLMEHPAFDITKPPACEHLLLGFADSVPNFHAEDGSGYAFMADAVLKVGCCWSWFGADGGARGRGASMRPDSESTQVDKLRVDNLTKVVNPINKSVVAAAGGQGEHPSGVRPGGDARRLGGV